MIVLIQVSNAAASSNNDESPTWEEDYAIWHQWRDGTGAAKNTMSAVRNRVSHRTQRQPPAAPGSDSGSSGSGKSSGSDSLGSRGVTTNAGASGGASASGGSCTFADVDRAVAVSLAPNSSIPPPRIPDMASGNSVVQSFSRNGGMGGACGGKVNRFKNKRLYPSVPNQPSEASAHFMFELAKTVLLKAGGNSSTSLFTQPINSAQNPRGPIRALQMCAFQIGLYALGLHNCVSAKWLSRTYSSHVSWITGNEFPIVSFIILIDSN